MSERRSISLALLERRGIGSVKGMFDMCFTMNIESQKEHHYFDDVKGMIENLDERDDHREVVIRVNIMDLIDRSVVCEVAYLKLKLVNYRALQADAEAAQYDDKGTIYDVKPILSTDEYDDLTWYREAICRTTDSEYYIAEIDTLYVSPSFRKRGFATALIENLNEYLYREFKGQILMLGVCISPFKRQLELDQFTEGLENEVRVGSDDIMSYAEVLTFVTTLGFKPAYDKRGYYWYKNYNFSIGGFDI